MLFGQFELAILEFSFKRKLEKLPILENEAYKMYVYTLSNDTLKVRQN